MVALPATSFPGAVISWSGEDDGSGIRSFDIYVSQDSGTPTRWLRNTTATQARLLDAEIGSTYAFYSVARDFVGNVESAPTGFDTSTLIVEPDTTLVTSVDVASVPEFAITVSFADPVVVESMITDGSIREAVSVNNLETGPIDLTNWQFSYDSGAQELRITADAPAVEGIYELKLNGEQFQTPTAAILRGGASGLVFNLPEFEAGVALTADGAEIIVDGGSTPTLVDWNNDGLIDLVVGEKASDTEGKLRVYLNEGTNEAPSYSDFGYAQTLDGDLIVSASGNLGVAPRLADWNDDDELDLVLGLADGRVQVWTNINNMEVPIFALPQFVQVGTADAKRDFIAGARASVAVVDWNNDGKSDLLVGGVDGHIQLLLNESATTTPNFVQSQFLQAGTGDLVASGGEASMDVADLNGDGRKDLIVGSADGELLSYLNVGSDVSPAFEAPISLDETDSFDSTNSRPFVADYDNDGTLDMVVGGLDGKVRLFAGVPGGTTPPPQPAIAGGPYSHTFAVVTDDVGPQVQELLVASQSWNEAFDHADGYSVPLDGTGAALPWSGIDQIKAVFSEDVVVDQGDLAVFGVNISQYDIDGFSYDAASHTATWTLVNPIEADKLLVSVSDGVTDGTGNALQATDVRFDVLPGDVNGDGSVAVSDIGALRTAMGQNAGDGDYNPVADIDGSGSVSVVDTGLFRGFLGDRLPGGEPVAMMFATAFASASEPPVMLPLAAEPTPARTAYRPVARDEAFQRVEQPLADSIEDLPVVEDVEPVAARGLALFSLFDDSTSMSRSLLRSRPAARSEWQAVEEPYEVQGKPVQTAAYDSVFDALDEEKEELDTAASRSDNLWSGEDGGFPEDFLQASLRRKLAFAKTAKTR